MPVLQNQKERFALGRTNVTRREMLRTVSASAGALALGSPLEAFAQKQVHPAEPPAAKLPKTETETAKKYPHPPGIFINRPLTQISKVADTLLDDMEGRGVAYFYEQSHPETGLVRDHAPVVGVTASRQGSIAATGFGLSALCIAAERHYLAPAVCEERVEKTLAFLLEECPHVYGFLYHWVDIESGQRMFGSELSSIDTSLLLCGVLHCKQYFSGNPRIVALANSLLQSHRLAVDAERRHHALHGLDTGEWIYPLPLGHVCGVDDHVPDGHRLTDASYSRGNLGCH